MSPAVLLLLRIQYSAAEYGASGFASTSDYNAYYGNAANYGSESTA
ncbi:MAG: hypothetical protein SWO11_17805 [Thermodesulfobacteriota bacterium]|nr:hypothetical protein [Thermodesulfobacteriota bacterium]